MKTGPPSFYIQHCFGISIDLRPNQKNECVVNSIYNNIKFAQQNKPVNLNLDFFSAKFSDGKVAELNLPS